MEAASVLSEAAGHPAPEPAAAVASSGPVRSRPAVSVTHARRLSFSSVGTPTHHSRRPSVATPSGGGFPFLGVPHGMDGPATPRTPRTPTFEGQGPGPVSVDGVSFDFSAAARCEAEGRLLQCCAQRLRSVGSRFDAASQQSELPPLTAEVP